jgi:hypothetical protein
VEGNNAEDPKKCLNLIGGIESDYTGSGVYCKFFREGGVNAVEACKNIMLLPIYSWEMHGGACLTYGINCTDPSVPNQLMTASSGCQNLSGDHQYG